ncbi:LysR family transcriptional regulator [Granulosicoccaceae sp. 1_MG-2023]|nr:LysR family transcriptional regulator [Granulosicoccaceae sp. 1_MG-2023]
MTLDHVDLNLLVYLDVLLRERNVTRAAASLGISQPALSNSLKRLRETFGDPLLVRTSEGMTPTERALELQPVIHQVLATIQKVVEPASTFDAASSTRVFRILTSDYGEATLIPLVLKRLGEQAPNVVLDILTPSDMSFSEVEQGHVDLVLNRFDTMPQAFHQTTLWRDSFSCLFSADNPLRDKYSLEGYLEASHVWVNKTGMGAGVGLSPKDTNRLGWVDEALRRIGEQRKIAVFTRHYQSAIQMAGEKRLVATLPTRATGLQAANRSVVIREPPFEIPAFEFKMAWSPLLQHNPAHQWLRRLVSDAAAQTAAESE